MDPAAPSHHPPPPPPVAPPRPPQEPAWARHLVQLDSARPPYTRTPCASCGSPLAFAVPAADPHPSPLSGTDDLISRFRLAPLYDTFLRPYLPPAVTAPSHPPPSLDPAPAPASPSPAPPHHLGLKITLGGVKFGGLGGSGTSAGGDSAEGASGAGGGAGAAGGEGKKRKRAKMDKTYEHMVGDVLGASSPSACSCRASPSHPVRPTPRLTAPPAQQAASRSRARRTRPTPRPPSSTSSRTRTRPPARPCTRSTRSSCATRSPSARDSSPGSTWASGRRGAGSVERVEGREEEEEGTRR